MRTPERLKGIIRNMAAQKNLRPQGVLRIFLFERVLERLTGSRYREDFILKGGLLISSTLGIEERITIDMNTTVRGTRMEEPEITSVIKEIPSTDIGNGIGFSFHKIEPICEDDTYSNFHVHIDARYGKIDSPMKLDITTGDKITPATIQYDYPLLFERKTMPVMTYTLETILAEEYEAIIRRNTGTMGTRDFHDLHTLYRERYSEIHPGILRMTVVHTAKKHGFASALADWEEILQDIREEPMLASSWHKYTAGNPYIGKLLLSEALDTVERVGRLLQG